MAGGANILLVEGRSDQEFYRALCGKIGLSPKVTIAPPRELGGDANNREGAFNHLPLLLDQLADGRIERTALIVDADYPATHGLGYSGVVDRIIGLVEPYSFIRKNSPALPDGLLFQSSEGFRDFGLWVMPGQRQDGMLENWIEESIPTADADLLAHAKFSVGNIASAKFKDIHRTKAEIATWLAWQKAPGRGLESSIKDELLDARSVSYSNLVSWLNAVFR